MAPANWSANQSIKTRIKAKKRGVFAMQKGIVCITVVGLIQISNVLTMVLRFITRCPKIAFFYQFFSSERFFYDSRRNISFQPVKSPYICVGQQRKEPVKKTAILGHVKRLNI